MVATPIVNPILTRISNQSDSRIRHRALNPLPEPEARPASIVLCLAGPRLGPALRLPFSIQTLADDNRHCRRLAPGASPETLL